jgi:signal transduction histidine kinase/CheY-like chemotaxis protein
MTTTSLKQRLFFLVSLIIIPLLAIAVSMFVLIRGAYSDYSGAARTREVLHVTVAAGTLVHALQIERGSSAGFLQSEGMNFSDVLPGFRADTDACSADLIKQVALVSMASTPTLAESVSKMKSSLSGLAALRSRVDKLDISSADGVSAYSALIASLIDVIGVVGHYNPDAAIAQQGIAYLSLVRAKEAAGQERALGTTVFSANTVELPELLEITERSARQNANYDVFRTAALPEENAALVATLEGAASSDVKRMRNLLVEKSVKGGFDIDPTVWFKRKTEVIDGLRKTETVVAGHIDGAAEKIVADSRRALIAYTVLGILVFVIVIAVARVDSRTEQLADARKLAETASLAKSVFLANMSHEIRTPMNAIVGLAHLLRRDQPTPQQVERLSKIDSAARHLLSVINDVLDISKIEASQLKLEQTDFHLGMMLDNVYSMIWDQAHAKGLGIEANPESVPLWLRGDPTRLRQALLNYTSNAIKFTASGFIAIRARLLEENDEGSLVRFEVEDTGIGIPADKQSNLFKAFEQADASTTRKYGGTGLGLAITLRLAQLMGGDAGVVSEPGRGTTFWFTARLQRGQGLAPVSGATGAEHPARELQRYAGLRILLVDDVAINREVALQLLEPMGLRIDTAEDGRDAVAKSGATDYALILMDVQMPVMDGFDATRAIHALPGRENTPVLAMTANAFDEDRRACVAAGMVDFVAKPVDPEVFFATLLKWLPEAEVGATETVTFDPVTPADSSGSADRTGAVVPDIPTTTVAAQADPSALTENLPGLDLDYGLKVWRKEDVYRNFLRQFASGYGDCVGTLRAALEQNDSTAVTALAHKLKGAAGNLAVTDVARIAGEIGHSLKVGTGGTVAGAILPLLLQLDEALATALNSIARYAPATDELESIITTLAPEQHALVSPLFHALLEALDTDDPARAEPVLQQLTTKVGATQLHAVRAALDDFDFRGAETAARELAESLNISLES